jgi:hypothetical protein
MMRPESRRIELVGTFGIWLRLSYNFLLSVVKYLTFVYSIDNNDYEVIHSSATSSHSFQVITEGLEVFYYGHRDWPPFSEREATSGA